MYVQQINVHTYLYLHSYIFSEIGSIIMHCNSDFSASNGYKFAICNSYLVYTYVFMYMNTYKLNYKGFEMCEICGLKVRSDHDRSQTTELWLSFPNINLAWQLFEYLLKNRNGNIVKKIFFLFIKRDSALNSEEL